MILCFIGWKIGLHDLYAGRTGRALVKLLLLLPTLGLYLFITGIIDLFSIANGNYQDAEGKYIRF